MLPGTKKGMLSMRGMPFFRFGRRLPHLRVEQIDPQVQVSAKATHKR